MESVETALVLSGNPCKLWEARNPKALKFRPSARKPTENECFGTKRSQVRILSARLLKS
jgi:hypothetical protein